MAFGNADSYARFMGRFSEPLAPLFADLVEVPEAAEDRVLDVGCGPGVLTAELVRRYGAERVDAIDPTPGFVAAARDRCPGVDVRQGTAEELPYADDAYAASYAQLVVHFMKDPVRGLAEMARVTEPGGQVAACVWDHGGGRGPLSLFWECAPRSSTPTARRKADASPGSHEGDLERLLGEAGLVDVRRWGAVGDDRPDVVRGLVGALRGAGRFRGRLPRHADARSRSAELRELCRSRLPDGPFELTVWTWTAVGRA